MNGRYHGAEAHESTSSREGDPSPATFGPGAWAPLATAWRAYQGGDRDAVLRVRVEDGEVQIMPVSLFFRSGEDLREVDREALARVRGRVLDVGAGVGGVALTLQADGVSVTALEVIPEGVEIMRERGVRDPVPGRLEALTVPGGFDTILLLMNGTALAGTLWGVPRLLGHLARLLAPGGQVLMDSTDVTGEGLGDPDHAAPDPEPPEGYPGEVHYQMEFRGVRGDPFPQLFLDPGTLGRLAREGGWEAEVVWRGEEGEYLARLTRPEGPP